MISVTHLLDPGLGLALSECKQWRLSLAVLIVYTGEPTRPIFFLRHYSRLFALYIFNI